MVSCPTLAEPTHGCSETLMLVLVSVALLVALGSTVKPGLYLPLIAWPLEIRKRHPAGKTAFCAATWPNQCRYLTPCRGVLAEASPRSTLLHTWLALHYSLHTVTAASEGQTRRTQDSRQDMDLCPQSWV